MMYVFPVFIKISNPLKPFKILSVLLGSDILSTICSPMKKRRKQLPFQNTLTYLKQKNQGVLSRKNRIKH